ncbi:hypothetical protein ACWGS5_17890 [Streptomyces albidoflavus]|uniref:hypothetical protein n=1 Tax=Streptomyces TaxID=1883 RepID=UPI0004C6CD47|nr:MULTISPECIES: hypothetical protein [Streptomyces]MBL0780018.1 hypothetical protein [Streptomyces albidoflavus]MBL0804140.1 hypothetical protein [Streptomyces albidoflavus]MBV1953662.1 hypothetical protein [Streptomyces sp. BV333]MCG5122538.1 hypothetical protein [Streptomyces sp. T7(2022)]MCQ9707310.1 hypothetical protein [Streptomyces sp. BSP1]
MSAIRHAHCPHPASSVRPRRARAVAALAGAVALLALGAGQAVAQAPDAAPVPVSPLVNGWDGAPVDPGCGKLVNGWD